MGNVENEAPGPYPDITRDEQFQREIDKALKYELTCECENYDRGSYHYRRDPVGVWRCEQCDGVMVDERQESQESAPELPGPTIEQLIEDHLQAILGALIQSVHYVQESPNLSTEDVYRFQRLQLDLVKAQMKCWPKIETR